MTLRTTLTAAAFISACLSLSGCVTSNMWKNNSPKSSEYRILAGDQIHAFGMVGRDNSQLTKGSLVMMGEKYWFVVNPQDSKELAGILNVKLDRQFLLVDKFNEDESLKALPVTLEKQDGAEFSSSFCLRYDTDKEDEAAKLEQLSFIRQKGGNRYSHCVKAKGKYYAAQQDMAADYTFEQRVPVEIGYHRDKVRGLRLLGNLAMTPLTLAADAVVSVFVFPVAIATFNP